MNQEQKQPRAKQEDAEIDDTQVPEPKDFDIDSILDEIDNVLEENAEEFVNGYIQRGGQ